MSRRLAILVGNQSFAPDSGFAPLRGPHNDVDALAEVLRDPARGDFTLAAAPLKDANRRQMLGLIERTLRAATQDDTVLIHYSGHGKPDDGSLYFAASDSLVGELTTTGVPAEDVQRLACNSACRTIILLLDCCYAGAIGQTMNAGFRGEVADEVQQQLRRTAQEASGLFILTSSTGWQKSVENEDERDGKVMGRFTRAVIERLTRDAPGQGNKVRFSDLSNYVRGAFPGQDAREFRAGAQGDPVIAHAPARETPQERRRRVFGAWVRDGVAPDNIVVPCFEAIEGKGRLVKLVNKMLDDEGMTPGEFIDIIQIALHQKSPRRSGSRIGAANKAGSAEAAPRRSKRARLPAAEETAPLMISREAGQSGKRRLGESRKAGGAAQIEPPANLPDVELLAEAMRHANKDIANQFSVPDMTAAMKRNNRFSAQDLAEAAEKFSNAVGAIQTELRKNKDEVQARALKRWTEGGFLENSDQSTSVEDMIRSTVAGGTIAPDRIKHAPKKTDSADRKSKAARADDVDFRQAASAEAANRKK